MIKISVGTAVGKITPEEYNHIDVNVQEHLIPTKYIKKKVNGDYDKRSRVVEYGVKAIEYYYLPIVK